MKRYSILVLVTFASMLGWAFTAEHFTNNYRKELTDHSWQVVKMQYKATYGFVNFKFPYRVSFTDSGLDVRLEKNQCGAKIRLTKNTFQIVDAGAECSTMCCDSPQGTRFAQALTSKFAKTYQIKNNQLIVKDKNYTFWFQRLKK